MSDHQQDHQHDDGEPAQAGHQPAPGTASATASDEPDFSRLRQARASLDNAFPQD